MRARKWLAPARNYFRHRQQVVANLGNLETLFKNRDCLRLRLNLKLKLWLGLRLKLRLGLKILSRPGLTSPARADVKKGPFLTSPARPDVKNGPFLTSPGEREMLRTARS